MVEKKVEEGSFVSRFTLVSQKLHIHQSFTAYPIAGEQVKVVIGNTQIEVKGGLIKR